MGVLDKFLDAIKLNDDFDDDFCKWDSAGVFRFLYLYRYGEAGYCNVSDTTGDFSSAIDYYLPIVYGN